MKNSHPKICLAFLGLITSCSFYVMACSDSNDPASNADTVDTDTDIGTDTDVDTDIDVDTDTDSDTNTGSDTDDSQPIIIIEPFYATPTFPHNLEIGCYFPDEPDTISLNCPTIRWNRITYWVYGFKDSSLKMSVVSRDANNTILRIMEKYGATSLNNITEAASLVSS